MHILWKDPTKHGGNFNPKLGPILLKYTFFRICRKSSATPPLLRPTKSPALPRWRHDPPLARNLGLKSTETLWNPSSPFGPRNHPIVWDFIQQCSQCSQWGSSSTQMALHYVMCKSSTPSIKKKVVSPPLVPPSPKTPKPNWCASHMDHFGCMTWSRWPRIPSTTWWPC